MLREHPRLPSYLPDYVFYVPNPGNQTRLTMKLELVKAKSVLVLGTAAISLMLVVHRWNLIVTVVPTILKKFVFYKYLGVFLGLLIQFVHCCLVTMSDSKNPYVGSPIPSVSIINSSTHSAPPPFV